MQTSTEYDSNLLLAEALGAAGDNFKNLAEKAIETIAPAQKAQYQATSAADEINLLYDSIKESTRDPAASTGFDILDRNLDGGLYPGLYILGALSSLGKTTLALQLADNLAQQDRNVIIFTLEMSKVELMSKSISHLTYRLSGNKKDAKTARGIVYGPRYKYYSQREKDLIERAIDKYKTFAKHIFFHEGIGNIGTEQIKEITKKHISITGKKPVIIIDYLQMLAPYNTRGTDKQNIDKSILELKRLSRDCNIPVIAISSFNRDSYRENSTSKGRASLAAFKESGAIEYNADVLIGLEFASAGEKEYSEREAKRKYPREIKLVIMKNRGFEAWQEIMFKYYTRFNFYEEWKRVELEQDEKGADSFKNIRQRP